MPDPVRSNALHGRLTRSSSGWILLSVPNSIQRGFFAALDAPGAELPLYKGRLNAHVSVIRPEELEQVGNPTINELGKFFSFNTGPFVEANPHGWDEMDRVWFMRVSSPELIKLRRSYGLSDLPKKGRKQLAFHLTIAVRRKGVLKADRRIAKAASAAEDLSEDAWFLVPKVAVLTANEMQDQASNAAVSQFQGSPTIEWLGALAQLWDGRHAGIPNKPSALASMLTLGMLGSGIGYGVGRVGGSLLNTLGKSNVDAAKVGRLGAVLGGAAGVVPGILYALGNVQAGEPAFTGAFLNNRSPLIRAQFKTSEADGHVWSLDRLDKQAGTGSVFNAEHFAKLVNEDPFVKLRLDPRDRAMATGLVVGAQHLPGRSNSPLVTPVDVARMAVGMGSGYLSGMVVGKTLGGLMGLPQTQQDQIIRAGTFAGAIKNVLPLAFPGM